MTSAELIQFGQQIAYLHRCRIEDAPGSGSSPPLRRGQTTVERLPDDGGDRSTALAGKSADPLVALIVDENLQPVCQHVHTLACAYAGDWVPQCRLTSAGLCFLGQSRGHEREARLAAPKDPTKGMAESTTNALPSPPCT